MLILCMIVATSYVNSQTTDVSLFGFKGKVTGASINAGAFGSFSFGEDGYVTNKIFLWDGTEEQCYDVEINKRTKNVISGESKYGKFSATIANNHITKIKISGKINNYPSTYTCTYSYDKKGNLVKVNEVFVYYKDEGIEYGGGVYGVDNYQRELNNISQEYQRKLMSGMTQEQAQQWYNNAVARLQRAAQGVGVNTYARTKKTKKTVKADYTYSNYVFDDFGNWISRTYQKGTDYQTQNQTINYDPDFWSHFYWERLEKEGDLRKIEAFYLHPITTNTYKVLASKYWNEHIMAEVAQKYNNNLDTLCRMAEKAIIFDTVKEQALDIVRDQIFNNDVMTERDYKRVSQMKVLRRQNVIVFNDIYQKKIDTQSEKLRTDSVNFLINKAQQEFESTRYQQALATSKGIIIIDPQNETAANLCQESSYRIILSKEAENSIQESDYVSFIDEYNASDHVPEIQNKRALYASSLFNRETSNEELERVNALPTDELTHKIVSKRYKKWMFKNNRGNFFHIGIGGGFAYGSVNTVASGEVTTRFGYTANLLNLTVGLKYNYLTSSSQMFKSPKESGSAYFNRQYLSIPIMLRFNFKHGYNGSSYFAAGTELNISTLSAKLRNVEDIDDKKFANDNISFTPRIALGGRFFGLEIELFGTYDVDNPFNVDYIKKYKLKNGNNIQTVCDKSAYDKQINGEDFFDKVRGGIALRIWF